MKLSHKGRKRHVRRAAVRAIRKGAAELRVGKFDEGYRLISSNGHVVPFGHAYPKMSEAQERGEKDFGQKPKRLTKKQMEAVGAAPEAA